MIAATTGVDGGPRRALKGAMLAATVSVGLMAAVFVLGLLLLLPRSYILSDGLTWNQSRFLNTVVSSQGRLRWQLLDSNQHPDWPQSPPQRGILYSASEPRSLGVQGRSPTPAASWMGFRLEWPAPHFAGMDDRSTGLGGWAGVPRRICRVLCSMSASRPAMLPTISRKVHICGYDLRTTPHRCPECGTIHRSTHPIGSSLTRIHADARSTPFG